MEVVGRGGGRGGAPIIKLLFSRGGGRGRGSGRGEGRGVQCVPQIMHTQKISYVPHIPGEP